MPPAGATRGISKPQAIFQCDLCPKRFTRAFNLRGHVRTHTNERPFVCTICGLGFARNNDRKSHESLHTEEKKFVCAGDLDGGQRWGCGRGFALAKNLKRHFTSEKGRKCIKPLLDEKESKRQAAWVTASALTGLADSPSAPNQDLQPSPPEQNRQDHEAGISIDIAPNSRVSNEGGQLSRPNHSRPRSSKSALPTRNEALKAADIVRRYIQYHGRLNTEENGFRGYLELTFVSVAAKTSSLEPGVALSLYPK